jgi:hypothetical protein
MKLRLLVVGAVCVCMALLIYLRSTLTYDHDVKRFEATVRTGLDPGALQSWATNLLTRYTASNTVSSELVSYQVKDLPTNVRNVSKLYPSAFLFAMCKGVNP